MKAKRDFVGRKAEVARLLYLLDEPGGLVLISGDAGVGKTRLVQETVTTAGRSTAWARPEQVTKPGPFALVVDLLENLVAKVDPDGQQAVRALSDRLLEPRAGETGSDLPGRRVAAELRGLISQIGDRPVVVFEDLQAADDASLAVVLHLSRSAVDDGYSLLATYRTEELIASESLERFMSIVQRDGLAEEIHLASLDYEESRELAEIWLGRKLSPDELGRIVGLADGIPFYIEELSAGIAEEGVPTSIRRAVLVRSHQLTAIGRAVVEAASITVGAIDSRLLAQALEIEVSVVNRMLVDALRVGLVVEEGGKMLFRHALVKEALSHELTAIEREELHRRLAGAIELLRADSLPLNAAALALHWYGARDLARALACAITAGTRALELASLGDAQQAFELALACTDPNTPSAQALVGLAEVAIRKGLAGEAADLLGRAAIRFQNEADPGTAATTLGRLAWVKMLDKRGADALEIVDRALALIEGHTDGRERARLLARKGQLLMSAGKLGAAEEFLRSALSQAEEIRDHTVIAESLDALAVTADERDDFEAVMNFSERACREATESDEAEVIGRTHNNRALWLVLRRDIGEGLATLQVARRRVEASFGVGGVAVLDVTEAVGRWRLGQPDAVARLLGKHANVYGRFQGYARMLHAWATMHAGDEVRARGIIDEGWRELGIDRLKLPLGDLNEDIAEAMVCEILVMLEEESSEIVRLARMMREAYEHRPADEVALARYLFARAAIAETDYATAARAVEEFGSVALLMDVPYFNGMHRELHGRIALLKEDTEGAVDAFQSAASIFASFDNWIDQGRSLRLCAAALAAQGKTEDAIGNLRRSRELAEGSGSILEFRKGEASLRRLGVRPRAGRPRKEAHAAGGLSTRELEVATLVAVGSTNAEIGSKLFLSQRTVQDHITHSLRKLGLPGRAALAAWAVKQRLI